MIDQNTHGEIIEQLRSAPDQMRRAIDERTGDDLQQPGKDGGLAVVEILCHLQDWEEINGERVARILHETVPHLEAYDDSLWSIEHDYGSRDGLAVLDAFALTRGVLVQTLTALTVADWQRQAELEAHGQITIEWLIARILHHDATHIEAIMEALA